MAIITGLSGNEMFCLKQKGFDAGNLVLGNSVFALGFLGSIGSGFNTLVGGEVTQVTQVIHDGRQKSYQRMITEARAHGGVGVTGVSSELLFHGSNVEFLSIGSTIHRTGGDPPAESEHIVSTSADGQELYCQLDCGFHPIQFVFGNVAYSIGVGGGLLGTLRSLGRGEVKEYSDVLNRTRHLALQRITEEASSVGANAVLGIQTSIMPLLAVQEMLMIGTASYNSELPPEYMQTPITSDLTNEEMWNIIKMGYCPVKLVLGVSVFSLGVVGGISAAFKTLVRGEISELTTMIYEARENALKKIGDDATACGADDVVGIKTYVYDLGSGMIELMAIGTAIKKMPNLQPSSPNLIPQAIIKDKDTFVNTMAGSSSSVSLNEPTRNVRSQFWLIIVIVLFLLLRMAFHL